MFNMEKLSKYVEEYENHKIDEASSSQPSLIDYDASDSGIMKLLKGFLRWANGSYEDSQYDPDAKDHDTEKARKAIESALKDAGEKYVTVETEVVDENKFKELLKKKSAEFFKKDVDANPKLYKNNSYRIFKNKKIEGVAKGNWIAAYSFNKSLHKSKYMYIVNIYAIPEYEDFINPKNITQMISKDMKSIDASNVKIRFVKGKTGDFGFESLMDEIESSNNFARDKDAENNSSKERIFVSTNKVKKAKKEKSEEKSEN